VNLLPQDRSRITTQRWAVYAVLVLVSAAGLAFQVALTRIFSLAQGHHFAFMAVSLTLLGFGASGAYLSLRPVSAVMLPRLLVAGSLGFALSVPAAYLIINNLPFDTYRIAWEPVQLIWPSSSPSFLPAWWLAGRWPAGRNAPGRRMGPTCLAPAWGRLWP
jgi:hypothetical protein